MLGGGSVRGSAPAPQFGGWMKDALSKRWFIIISANIYNVVKNELTLLIISEKVGFTYPGIV